jgi:hypothetical protein
MVSVADTDTDTGADIPDTTDKTDARTRVIQRAAGRGDELRERTTRPDARTRTKLTEGAAGRCTLNQEAPVRSTTEKPPAPTLKVHGGDRSHPPARGGAGGRRATRPLARAEGVAQS